MRRTVAITPPARMGATLGGAALVAAALVNPAVASAHSFVVTTAPHRDAATTAPAQVTTTWNEAVTNVKESVTGPRQSDVVDRAGQRFRGGLQRRTAPISASRRVHRQLGGHLRRR